MTDAGRIAKLIAELPKYRDAFEDLYDQGTALLERFGVQEASLIEQLRSIVISDVHDDAGLITQPHDGYAFSAAPSGTTPVST